MDRSLLYAHAYPPAVTSHVSGFTTRALGAAMLGGTAPVARGAAPVVLV